jgi:hypothetical protein
MEPEESGRARCVSSEDRFTDLLLIARIDTLRSTHTNI